MSTAVITPRALKGLLVFVLVSVAASLGGCAGSYHEMGLTGGVRAVEISSDVAQVSARGFIGGDPDAIERFVFRKAAETTVTQGYDSFEILSTADRTRSLQAVGGYTAASFTGFSSGGLALPLVRPGESVLIRMFHGQGVASGASVFDAHDVLSHLADTAQRGKRFHLF